MDSYPAHPVHSERTEKILGVFYDVYNEFGHGFLESSYAAARLIALQQSGLKAAREVPVPVWFRADQVGQYFADILTGDTVRLERKTARTLEWAHEAQRVHSRKATRIEAGLVLNFGVRPQFRRFLLENERKKIGGNPCESVAKAFA